MQANRSRDTGPEMALRRLLHARGLRYRTGMRLDLGDRKVRPDIVFTRAKIAVFVDGCYWHRCPEHATLPKANAHFWQAKFERNVERDRLDDEALRRTGWSVERIWEHEAPELAAARVAGVVPRPARDT